MPQFTATYYSVQQTIVNALYDGTSTTQLPPGIWGKGKYCASYDLSTPTNGFDKSQTLGMVTLPAGVIVLGIDILISASLSTAVLAIGTTVTAAKYRAALVHTTPLINWINFQVATQFVTQLVTPLAIPEMILITNDATADLPTTGIIGMVVHTTDV